MIITAVNFIFHEFVSFMVKLNIFQFFLIVYFSFTLSFHRQYVPIYIDIIIIWEDAEKSAAQLRRNFKNSNVWSFDVIFFILFTHYKSHSRLQVNEWDSCKSVRKGYVG